jgi:lysophospholipase L1-like esterase
MKRFVYAPRAYAFVKNGDGQIRDISEWIVRGHVRRVIGAVSSAGLTLRNPDKIFTTPDENGVTAFMPMDPITIYLKRIRNRPVRVFTGFLDTTPYLQLFPGTVELKASCTLKRLQYTYFDPALPYTQSFLANYGWINKDGVVYNLDGLNDWKRVQDQDAAATEGAFKDGSVAELLAATLHHIGHWDYNDIHIERMPRDIFTRMANLYEQFDEENTELRSEIETLLAKIIGEAEYGTGDSDTSSDSSTTPKMGNNPKDIATIVRTIKRIADKANVDAAMAIATTKIESDFGRNMHRADAPYWGWYQINVNGSRYGNKAGEWSIEQLQNLEFACTAYCRTAARDAGAEPSLRNNPLEWTMVIQGVGRPGAVIGPNDLFPNKFPGYYAEAKKLISQYASGTAADAPGATLDDAATDATARAAGSTKGGTGGGRWKIQSGVPNNITQAMKDFLDAMAGYYEGTIIATTTTNHSKMTANGNVSDHYSGNAVDLGSVANWGGQVDGAGGTKLAVAAYRAAGFSYSEAVRQAATPQYTRYANGKVDEANGVQILWRVADHHDHVHIGVRSTTKAASVPAVFNEGDSLAVGSAASLKSLLQRVTTDAAVGRHTAEGVSRLKAKKNLPENLIVQLGTNDISMSAAAFGAHVDTVLGLSGVKNVFWVNIAVEGVGDGGTTLNGVLDAKAQSNPNLTIIDWAGAVSSGDVQLSSDGIHPTSTSYAKRGKLIADKVGAVLPQPSGGGSSGDAASGSNDVSGKAFANAAAFAATFNAPTLFEGIEAIGLIGEKSLLNDKPLLPFIQQLSEASLRNFQSLPDGKFFAFYPDYFGEMAHHPPYWEIEDIEILDGHVELSDDALVTHMYVVGDTTFPSSISTINTLTTGGVISVYNAYMSDSLLNKDAKDTTPAMILDKDEAAAFLERFGARPLVEEMPMIHSHFFEMFLAYQRFMLAWARQFITTFEFTFMPELYPGGKVGFPSHGLQMYIEDVTHTFDYESGFTTTANLSAPSVYGKANTNSLPKNMIKAVINSTGQKAVAAAKEEAAKDAAAAKKK